MATPNAVPFSEMSDDEFYDYLAGDGFGPFYRIFDAPDCAYRPELLTKVQNIIRSAGRVLPTLPRPIYIRLVYVPELGHLRGASRVTIHWPRAPVAIGSA